MNNSLSGPTRDLDTPKKNLRSRPSPIVLWRPEIVLPERPVAYRPIIIPGEPALRPEATRAQLDSTRTALDDVLTGTMRELTSLMKARGLR